MPESELSYTERKSLLGFGRHLERLRSRIAHRMEHSREEEIVLFVLDRCIGQIHAYVRGKVPNLSIHAPGGNPSPQLSSEEPEDSLTGYLGKDGATFERRYAADSPAGLSELRAHFEVLKRRLDEEFGMQSDPSRIVATAITELNGRVRQIMKRLHNKEG